LNQSEPNLILTAHATKLNRPEPNWTEPQTCLAGRNHAFSRAHCACRHCRFCINSGIERDGQRRAIVCPSVGVYCRVLVRLTKLRVNNTENAKQNFNK